MNAMTTRWREWLGENRAVLLSLVVVALIAYGFELFNLNLTIDEEVYAFTSAPAAWVGQGRWGMYLLNRFLLPNPVLPVVPLGLALAFHVAGVLLLLHAWGVTSPAARMLAGGLAVAFPGLAFLYSFSTLGYGIGIGIFCVALSTHMLGRASRWSRLLAAVPAAVAISIYQGFLPALAVAYLVWFMARSLESRVPTMRRDLAGVTWASLVGVGLYFGVQQLFEFAGIRESGYIAQYFDLAALGRDFPLIVSRTWSVLTRVYSGDAAVYGRSIPALAPTMAIAAAGLVIEVIRSGGSAWRKALLVLLGGALLLLPFLPGLLTRGELPMRFLVSLPVLFLGWIALGWMKAQRVIALLLAVVGGICLFQFAVAINGLFSASRFALEADRFLASRVVAAIDEARASAARPDVRYLEVVGYYDRSESQLIPKVETIGASFFEWDQGNVYRIHRFLETLGYSELEPLPPDRRAELVEVGNAMSTWPETGSVRIAGDTVIVKFGPYSSIQRRAICQATWVVQFCP